MRVRLPVVSRRRYQRDIASAELSLQALLTESQKAYEELKAERDGAAAGRDYYCRQSVTLTQQLTESHAREDDLAKQAEAQNPAGEIHQLRRRIKHLEKQLDDATSLGDTDWRRHPTEVDAS